MPSEIGPGLCDDLEPMRWTYNHVIVTNEASLTAMLELQGLKGWELVSVLPKGDGFRLVFKKPQA